MTTTTPAKRPRGRPRNNPPFDKREWDRQYSKARRARLRAEREAAKAIAQSKGHENWDFGGLNQSDRQTKAKTPPSLAKENDALSVGIGAMVTT